MTYSIIGFGAVGKALAGMFARQGLDVAVASTRSPDQIADAAKATGPTVTAMSLADAAKADVILLAVPFGAVGDVAAAATDWTGKTIIDVINAYGVPVEELGGRPSSAVVADAFAGASLVKAFNHLPAGVLAQDPAVNGGRRVIFLASDDEGAVAPVEALVSRLGYAPVRLGALAEGGALVQARGRSWAPLIFQDFVKVG